jgi:tetratricopeptide (TPR) repeat protein
MPKCLLRPLGVVSQSSNMPGHNRPENILLAQFVERRRGFDEPAARTELVEALSTRFTDAEEVWRRAAEGLLRAGYAHAAAEVLNVAIARFAGTPALRYWRGNALRVDGLHDEAERDFRAVLAVVAEHREAAFSLAHMLRESGRFSAAIEVVCASLRACADDRQHIVVGLVFLRECDAHVQASALATAARERWPECARISALVAEFALATGDFEGTRAALHAALEGNAGDGMSWLRLAYCGRCTNSADPDLRRIEHPWRNSAHDGEVGTCLGFALGKMLSDIGEYSHAVSVLREANAAAAAQARGRVSVWRAFADHRLKEPRLPQAGSAVDYVPVFVVGLPRTGTTLAASLLARNGELRNRGELNWIDAMYHLLDRQRRLHDRDALASTSAIVRSQLRRDDPPVGWYLDKNPLNFRYLDFIAAMFPGAKIIHCRRGRRDTALSLWTQRFAHADLGFAYDFSDIAAFMEGHDQLVEHWRNTLPLAWFDMDYEALVENPEETVRGIRHFLGMPDDWAMTGPDMQTITTASVWQARQPLYASSIGRWSAYAAHLPELERMF